MPNPLSPSLITTHARPALDVLRGRWFAADAAGEVHLNAGTLSPTPRPVFDAVTQLRREQAASPSAFFFHRSAPLIRSAREALAGFLNASADDLYLFPNVTFAINLVMQSLPFEAGDEILTSDHEYGAMDLLLDAVALRTGATVRRVVLPYRAEDPAEIVDAFRRGWGDRTRACFFCHITSTSALTLPAAGLCGLARERGAWSIVDGAHAPGAIDLDLAAIGADAYGGNCHKWMMAPAGCGFLHVSPALAPTLRPLVVSWGVAGSDPTAARDDSSDVNHARLEYLGVYDRTPQMVLPSAIAALGEVGRDRIRERVASLKTYCRQKLESIGLPCASPRDERLASPMTIFDLTQEQAEALQRTLWPKHRVLCPVTHVAGRQFLRVSTAWFNTEDELDGLAAAVVAAAHG